MSGISIVVLLFGGALYYVFTEVSKFKTGISGTRSERVRAIDELKESLLAMELLPWNCTEIHLLSHQHSLKESFSALYADYTVVWQSIYQEPIIAAAERRFKDFDNYSLVIRINNDLYCFVPIAEIIELHENDQIIGRISPDKPLSLKIDHSGEIISVDSSTNTSSIPIFYNEEQVWRMARLDPDHTLTRMINVIKDQDKERSKLLILMIIYALMRQHI